jgi:acyl-CoA synthetase (AMP-forming)/AMP-acid ligase II
MRTTPKERIDDYTNRGWWGSDTLHSKLAEAAKACGDMLAVADQPNRQELTGDEPKRLTFAELDVASTNLAHELNRHGLGKDDRLVVQLPNVAELFVLYMAASKLGVIVSPAPVQYGPHELAKIAATLEPKAVVTMGSFGGQPLPASAEGVFDDTVRVLRVGDGADLFIETAESSAAIEWLAEYSQSNPVDANDVVTVCWTSGTTGTPKGVPRSHNMWFATARGSIEAGGYREGDRLLNPFPLVNMAALGGFVFPSVLARSSVILHHPLDPGVYLAQLQNEKITFTIAPPPLLNQLAKSADMWNQFDFSSLRSVGSGSAPLAPWMIRTFSESYGVDVINFYGSNEGIGLICTPEHTADPEERATSFPAYGADAADFAGYAASVTRTRVADPSTGELISEPGVPGELLIDGAMLFDGYLDADNTDVFTTDGYFRTGDLVEIVGDPPKFYRIAGRCKDIINRGGMKISPAEIDVLLEGFPGVAEAAVCSYPDERLGERICACFVMEPGTDEISVDDVAAFLTEKGLAKFKLPERVEFLDALPRNPLGKVQRFLLQEQVGGAD